jgi:hypothetical protein
MLKSAQSKFSPLRFAVIAPLIALALAVVKMPGVTYEKTERSMASAS